MHDQQDPAAIYGRFERTLLTVDRPAAQEYFEKISEVGLAGLDNILTDYEIFLFTAMLVNVREIRELKDILDNLL